MAKTKDLTVSLPRLHAGQELLLHQAKRFNVVCCGRRFGKTKFGVTIAIKALLRGERVAWFAPNYTYIREVWAEVKSRLGNVTKRVSEQEKRLETITGGVMELWHLESENVARGQKYHLAIIDEAAMARNLEAAWNGAIRATLMDYAGSAWFLSTPQGDNYFKTLWDAAEAGAEGWQNFKMPTATNPHIAESEIYAAEKALPAVQFRQEILADFVTVSGTLVRVDMLRRGTAPPCQNIVMGVDLAISTREGADYTACVILGQDVAGTTWVLDAQRMRGQFNDVLTMIKNLSQRWNPGVIAIEAVQYQAAVVQELLRTTQLPVRGVKPDKDKQTRFLPLQARYEQRLIWHSDMLTTDFERELTAFPLGRHDDYVDAVSYAYAELAIPVYTYNTFIP